MKPCPFCASNNLPNRKEGCFCIIKSDYLSLVDAYNVRPLEDALEAQIERLRGILKIAYEAIESLPLDAFGEASFSACGEECKYPIRDELLNTIAAALPGGG